MRSMCTRALQAGHGIVTEASAVLFGTSTLHHVDALGENAH